MKREKVGPGAPPRSGRFQKGRSGNPRGRPKCRVAAPPSALEILFERPLRVIKNGVETEVSMEEGLQLAIYRDAIAGKALARRQVLKWMQTRDEQRKRRLRSKRNTKSDSGAVQICWHEPDNADDVLLLLGIACLDPKDPVSDSDKRLLLEPWAVQMALSRRHGGQRLTSEEISDIKRCSHEPETLRWPRVDP